MGENSSCVESKIDEKLINISRFVKEHMDDKDCLELDKYYQNKNDRPRRQNLQIESIECKSGPSGPYGLYVKLNVKVSCMCVLVMKIDTGIGGTHTFWCAVKFKEGRGGHLECILTIQVSGIHVW